LPPAVFFNFLNAFSLRLFFASSDGFAPFSRAFFKSNPSGTDNPPGVFLPRLKPESGASTI
jgi:hypothetical protein